MDRSDAKGQYFLTGSQNFSVLKNIAESMAGRVAIFHLEHLTPQEMLGKGKEGVWLSSYFQNPASFYQDRNTLSSGLPPLIEFLFRGAFPATVGLPTGQIPRYMSSYLQTYVDRDVRTMEGIKSLSDFDRFLGIAAALTAQEINASRLGREIELSPQTARRWLALLLYTYQWVELFPYHGNTIKRISGKKKGYFKDTGFACYLQAVESYGFCCVKGKIEPPSTPRAPREARLLSPSV
jgi:hypothetical protein